MPAMGRFSLPRVIRGLLLATLFCAPLAVSLTPGVLLEVGKWVVVFLLGASAFLLALRFLYKTREIEIPRSPVFASGGLVLLTTFLSALFSGSIWLSLFGTGHDIVSFFSLLFFFSILWLFGVFFQEGEEVAWAGYALFASFVCVIGISLLHIFYPGLGVLSFLVEPTANVFGKWSDLGAFSGLILILTLFLHERGGLRYAHQVLLLFLFVLSFLGTVIVHSSLAVFLILLASGALIVRRLFPSFEGGNRLIHRASFVFFVLLVCTVWGTPNQIADRILGTYQLPQSDSVRLAWVPTLQIFGSVFAEDPIFGVGPGKFGEAWLLYRPDSVNQTDYWNSTFDFGVGFVPTTLVTSGTLGFLAWLLFLGAILFSAIQAFRSWKNNRIEREHEVPLLVSGAATAYLWAICFFSVPNTALLFLAFAATGIFLSTLHLSGHLASTTISFKKGERWEKPILAGLIFLALFFGWRFLATLSLYSAQKEFAGGMELIQKGALGSGVAQVKEASLSDQKDSYYRALADISVARLTLITSQKKELSPVETLEFQRIASEALSVARAAVVYAPRRFLNWSTLGNVYYYLHSVGLPDAKQYALDAYTQADALFPTTPSIPFSLARLEFTRGDLAKARGYLATALKRKNDYTPALLLLSELEARSGKAENALQSARKARDLKPEDPATHFELGLISYFGQKPNYQEAETAFSKVLELVPDYANARYFLALSKASGGKIQEARAIFEELYSLHPENTELPKIIANLDAEQPVGNGLFE